MSQTTLANKLGIACQQIQKYENGTNAVSSVRLIEICRILEVPVSYFIPNEGVWHIDQKHSNLISLLGDRQCSEALYYFSKLSSSKLKDKILKLLAHLTELEY